MASGPQEQVPAADNAGKMTLDVQMKRARAKMLACQRRKTREADCGAWAPPVAEERRGRQMLSAELLDFCGQTEFPILGLPQLSHNAMEAGRESVLHESHMVLAQLPHRPGP